MLRLTILLGPSYFAAYLTGEMVWVVPTLAGSGAMAASIGSGGLLTRRVDEDGDDGDDGDGGEEAAHHDD